MRRKGFGLKGWGVGAGLVWLSGSSFAAPPVTTPTRLPLTPKAESLTPIYTVAFAPDGKRLAVGGYKRVTLYDTETGKPVAQYVVGKDAVRTVAFSADGKRLLAGSGVPGTAGTVAIVDAGTGKPIRMLSGHEDTVESVACAGNLVLSAADDETIEISDMASGKTVGTLREHVGRCLAVAVPTKTGDNEGGNIFVTSGADNMVKVWDADKRRVVVNFDQAQGPVWSLAMFPRPGRFIAGSADGHLRWYGINTERERQLPNGDKEAIVPQNGEPQPRNGYMERDILAHEGGVYAVAASPDDKFLVSGGADGKVIVWNLGGGKIREWTDSEKDILSVAIAPDGKRIASASLDGRVRVYDAEKGTATWTYPIPLPDPIIAGTGNGLTASYFKNIELTGEPALRRTDGVVDFNYATEPAAPEIGKENFSVRWEGFYEAPISGSYSFVTRSDDGVRLWVDNKPVIDNWTGHGTTEDTAKEPVTLKKGQRVSIKMEYFQGGGPGEIHLLVGQNGQASTVIPRNQLISLLVAPKTTLPAKPVIPQKLLPAKPKP